MRAQTKIGEGMRSKTWKMWLETGHLHRMGRNRQDLPLNSLLDQTHSQMRHPSYLEMTLRSQDGI